MNIAASNALRASRASQRVRHLQRMGKRNILLAEYLENRNNRAKRRFALSQLSPTLLLRIEGSSFKVVGVGPSKPTAQKTAFIYYFPDAIVGVEDFCQSRFAVRNLSLHRFKIQPIEEHELYLPLRFPGKEYNSDDVVIIILGNKIPFRCHFDFLPPEGKDQVEVIVVDDRFDDGEAKVDHSKIMIGVRRERYQVRTMKQLDEVRKK